MSIVVIPQKVVALSEFLSAHDLTLIVREKGGSTWEASFSPELLQSTVQADVFLPVVVTGESREQVVEAICKRLSGSEGLSIDERNEDLDLYYTKVEYDFDPEKAETPLQPSLLKGVLRHHGGE